MRNARGAIGWVAEQVHAGALTPAQGLEAAGIMAGAMLSFVAGSNIDYAAIHRTQDALIQMIERKFAATDPTPVTIIAPVLSLQTARLQRSKRPWLLRPLHEGPAAPPLPGV